MTATKQVKPATPLPWTHSGAAIRCPGYPQANGSFTLACTGDDETPHNDAQAQKSDAAYIVAACNAYPKLVEALRATVQTADEFAQEHQLAGESACITVARALLRELGEAA